MKPEKLFIYCKQLAWNVLLEIMDFEYLVCRSIREATDLVWIGFLFKPKQRKSQLRIAIHSNSFASSYCFDL